LRHKPEGYVRPLAPMACGAALYTAGHASTVRTIVSDDCPRVAWKLINESSLGGRAKRFDAAQISARSEKEPAVVYTIIAESKNRRLLVTADTGRGATVLLF
jgi:hypothetical protein